MPTKQSSGSDGPVSTARVALAVLLGAVAFVLLFVLGEGVTIPDTVPGSGYIKMGILVGGMAGYFVMAQLLLSKGHPQAVRKDWPLVLALNLGLILLWVMVLREGPVVKALYWLAAIALTVACSLVGAALAARMARHHQQRAVARKGSALP